jgi:hypothetical protein
MEVVRSDQTWAHFLASNDWVITQVAPRGGPQVLVTIEFDGRPSGFPPMTSCEPGGAEGPPTGMDFLVDLETREILALSPRWGSISCLATGPIPSFPPLVTAGPSEATELGDLVECREVPEDLCFEYAINMMRGPQPEYAEGAGIERVLVTCERLPPCGADRQDSGGTIMILYTNGWAWSQDWAVGSGL